MNNALNKQRNSVASSSLHKADFERIKSSKIITKELLEKMNNIPYEEEILLVYKIGIEHQKAQDRLAVEQTLNNLKIIRNKVKSADKILAYTTAIIAIEKNFSAVLEKKEEK